MNNYSPNMLKTFKSCPQKYRLKYIEKISVPQKASVFEKGKKVHALANYYLRGFDVSKLEKTLTEDEKKSWENLKNSEYFQKTYVNSEYTLSCKVSDFWIGGRLDAVVKDEDYYYILDYKTGSIPENPEYDFQTMVYMLCLSKKFGKNIKFVYIDLKNNTNCLIDFSAEEEYKNLIIKIRDEIIKTNFNFSYSKKCDYCEYSKICCQRIRE